MAHLSLIYLGPFQATLNGQPVSGFKSNKVRALLAYLAVEADRPHGRETLAGLLWPDWPDRDALSNVRYALSNLRRVIGDQDAHPPFLLITRDTLQFNTASDHSLDIALFAELAEADETHPDAVERLEQAIALVRGSFLEGFSVGDSAPFEEWALFTRERLGRQMSSVLHRLAAIYEQRGQYEQAEACARRQIELEPWDEAAHQQLLRTLALSGQRGAALAHYETCCRLLDEELGVEPAQETTRLYEQIRDGALKAREPVASRPSKPAVEPPAFLDEARVINVERPVFVARDPELAQLDHFLELSLAGQGRVAFVTGEAGSGKTALIQEFTRRAQDTQADQSASSGQALVIASGNCNAYTGLGDPYLPFREILELLTGDVEAKWAAGAITREHARRLWQLIPTAAQALVEAGPDLIDTFIPRAAFHERLMTYTPWPGRAEWLPHQLEKLLKRKPVTGSGAPGPQQSDLFEQVTRVLQALAQRRPLLLVVDDLQWADVGSISLLFHLGRHLAGSRILILGAYRPEEVALGRDGERHPLEPVVHEFQRDFGDLTVNLDQAERRVFVEALLDSEPNRLGATFREMLHRQTRGHPLFCIELLRSMQERGDLVQNPQGHWVEGPALDWKTLPARVEAAIAERFGRLAQPLRAVLQVASVEGEGFTAEVVARVQGTDGREVVRRLSGELDRRHRLVRAQAIERLGSQRISRYRFRNYLFQKYLYERLDDVERAYLHEDVGNALEELYGDPTGDLGTIAVQLAWHFQEAGIAEKAIPYLQKAGEKAVQQSAYQEAVTHLARGLDLLVTLPNSSERAQQELALQLTLSMAWQGAKHACSPEVTQAFTRAYELCQQAGDTTQLCQILGQMVESYYVAAELQTARKLAEEALSEAHHTRDPLLVALGHWYLGFISFSLAEHATAHSHLEQVISFYDPQAHHQSFVALRGKDPGVAALGYVACCLWCLGYPEQALKRSQEAFTLARELDHPFSLADVLSSGGCLFNWMRRDGDALQDNAEELMRLSREKVPGWRDAGTSYQGQSLVLLGQYQQGIKHIRAGLTLRQSMGSRVGLSGTLGALAEAQTKVGRPDEALDTLAEALTLVEETDERFWEAELHRLRAELLRAQGDDSGAEASLEKAIDVSRRQNAKSLELRATTSLARLWRKQGSIEEARQLLGRIYDWFTEGFDTPDLKQARALLEELS